MPGGVQHFDQRAIAQAARRGDVGLLDEPLDLFDAEKFRQRRPRARRLKIVGGIGVEMLREHGEAVEAAHGSDRARDRARRQPFVHHAVDEIFEIAAVQALKRLFERRRRILQAAGDRGCSSRACDRRGAVRRADA